MYLNFELIFRLLLELLEPEQLPLLYLDLDKVLQIGNKFGKIFLILLMMTMLLILPLMMEFKEVEDSLLQCCYVWHGIVQVWLFSVKAIFTKKFHENDFTEFFFIFTGTWCKSALNGGSDGGTMRFKPECDHGGNAGKNLFVQKKKLKLYF